MYNKLLYGTISSRGKEAVRRLSHRLSSKPLAAPFLQTRTVVVRPKHEHILRNEFPLTKSAFNTHFIANSRGFSTHSSADQAREGWLAWLGRKKKVIALGTISLLVLGQFTSRNLNSFRLVKAGDPRLVEPVREVYPEEIGSERIQKVIDDLFKVMREQNLISLSAPQIGVPLQIIMLDIFPKPRLIWWIEIIMLDIFRLDLLWKLFTKKKESYEAEDKRPHHLMVILNPKVNSLSVPGSVVKDVAEMERVVEVELKGLEVQVKGLDQHGQFKYVYHGGPGYAAGVKGFLDVELSGLTEYGQPIKVHASGPHARALQQSLITFGTKKNTKSLLAKERDQQGLH